MSFSESSPSPIASPKKDPIVICGGGIVGCSTAYYLARRGVSSVIVERYAIAGCASGKAGGFLAKTWCTDCGWDAFARSSFDLHMELAERFPECDYRRIDALRIVVSNGGQNDDTSESPGAKTSGCGDTYTAQAEGVRSGNVTSAVSSEIIEQKREVTEPEKRNGGSTTTTSHKTSHYDDLGESLLAAELEKAECSESVLQRNLLTAEMEKTRSSSEPVMREVRLSDPKLLHQSSEDDSCDLSLVPPWVNGHVTFASKSGDPSDSAQVHPRKLCNALLAAAQSLVEVTVVEGQVTGFLRTDRRVSGVRVTNSENQSLTLSGSAVVIAMGPWSGQACQWLGLPPLVGGCRGHSVVAKVPPECLQRMTPTALFTELVNADDQEMYMEIYPRPDGTIYMCGLMDYQRVPSCGASVIPSRGSIQLLKDKAAEVSSFLGECQVLSEQACFMPRTEDDNFVIGQLPGAPGAFIGSGHNYWGILGGPATGRALSELIVDGHCSSFDIGPFNPCRFFAAKPKNPAPVSSRIP